MRIRLLVRHILFFSICLLILTGRGSNFAQDYDYSAIRQNISPEEMKQFEFDKILKEQEALEYSQKYIDDFLRLQEDNYFGNVEYLSKTIQEYFQNKGVNLDKEQLANFYYKDLSKIGSCSDCQSIPDGIYVLVSFSLPDEYLRSLIEEAWQYNVNRENKLKVSLVIQGFVKDSMKETAKAIFKLMNGKPDKAAIDINPEIFKEFDIKKVPYFIYKEGNLIRKLAGAVSISYFIEKINNSSEDDLGVWGQLYNIQETNFYDLIAAKQHVIEEKVRAVVERVKRDALFVKGYDFIKPAKVTRSFTVDPSYVLPYDIKNPITGEILFAKGTKVDPTEYAPFPKTIIINVSRKEEVDYFLKNKDKFEVILVAYGDLGEFMTKFHRRAYKLTSDIQSKFNITKTPSIIEQDGKLIKVTEVAVK